MFDFTVLGVGVLRYKKHEGMEETDMAVDRQDDDALGSPELDAINAELDSLRPAVVRAGKLYAARRALRKRLRPPPPLDPYAELRASESEANAIQDFLNYLSDRPSAPSDSPAPSGHWAHDLLMPPLNGYKITELATGKAHIAVGLDEDFAFRRFALDMAFLAVPDPEKHAEWKAAKDAVLARRSDFSIEHSYDVSLSGV